MKIKVLNETRKDDELYFQGAFWIKANSFKDIMHNKFDLIIGSKILSDYSGNYVDEIQSKNSLSHKNLWNNVSDGHSWTYYPRGRVAIYNGVAYIHLNSKCNTPEIIDRIIKEYNLEKLETDIDLNDTYQGSHYDFELK